MTLYLSNRDGNGKTSEEGHYRLQTQVLSGDVLGGSLLVTQNSPTGMSVLVTSGDFKIDTGLNYSYTGWASVNEVITISTADPANPRITTIVAYTDKGALTSASPPNNPGINKLMAINGTPQAVPTAPNGTTIQSAVGAGNPYIILADVRVNAAATSILNANITDRRTPLQTAPNMVRTTSIVDSSVTNSKIADNAVTTSKILDSNVTTNKLANLSVTAAKIETQQAWIVPTMVNSWVRYDTTYDNVGYMRDSLGFVHLRGLIKSGTAANMFQLPVGYRPLQRRIYSVVSNNSLGRVDVGQDGWVTGSVYSNAWVSLEGITFKAEQ